MYEIVSNFFAVLFIWSVLIIFPFIVMMLEWFPVFRLDRPWILKDYVISYVVYFVMTFIIIASISDLRPLLFRSYIYCNSFVQFCIQHELNVLEVFRIFLFCLL